MKAFLWGLVLSSAVLLGCGGVPVEAARTYHDSVGAAFLRYLAADKSLDDDQKRIRRQPVESFERILKQAEK